VELGFPAMAARMVTMLKLRTHDSFRERFAANVIEADSP
jgi:hypothetical protein